ncbi:RcnB family protein [Cobetia sp. 1AS1]|uniref:RcnB family protein n=1 Tax=Cobetia sp. 1AS1 TaxID=3040016 RepID=UPI00244D296E|nr:RcnB family protein [Cobetia sp. 1AS1]MDH2293637.1 RcnB family protein [Cobetia sp. 1AS1]
MAKRSFAVLTLMLSLLGAGLVQADSAGDGNDDKGEERLRQKHHDLEGQVKAQRVQAQQMRELKKIQHQEKLAEKKAVAEASPAHVWKRGGKVPDTVARDDGLRVENWQQHKLSEPGANQRWLQLKNAFVLMNTESHVIDEIVLEQ